VTEGFDFGQVAGLVVDKMLQPLHNGLIFLFDVQDERNE
jgi:hypothetical protein